MTVHRFLPKVQDIKYHFFQYLLFHVKTGPPVGPLPVLIDFVELGLAEGTLAKTSQDVRTMSTLQIYNTYAVVSPFTLQAN